MKISPYIKFTVFLFGLLLNVMFFNTISFSQDEGHQTHDSLKIDYNYINTTPQNADVYVNDEYAGSTPLFIMWGDSVFPKQVKIKMKGYADHGETVYDAELFKKTIKLVPLSGTRLPVLVKQDKSTHFHSPRKIAPIILTGLLTAGAGFAAYYFKSLAIENRDHYTQYNDQTSLDKKKKYDVLSGVSIGVFQLGFGALMYFLFID